ncbi:MAG: zinc ABC transporter substrate-binding protein, partial [Phycisphaerales bacterium]
IILAAALLLAALFGACQRAETPADDPGTAATTYTVVATTGMITDITRRIAADRAEVIGLINSGIDPHLYQPTRDDIARLVRADIVLYNGLLLEGKMTDALVRVASGTEVVAVAAEIDESALLSPPDYEGHHDPHVWMDPLLWIHAAQTIAATLQAHDPAGADTYRANADQLIGEIRALHDYAAEALGSIPERQRVLVTAHDAFGYFGQRYGLEVVGIQGISTESEAGVRDIERIVDLLVTRQIGAVFVETTVSERNIRALIAGANDRGHTVRVGGSLYSDAMGPSGTYEGTYIGMIDHNVTTIARALGGQAPAGGLNGKLTTQQTPQESP